MYLKETGCGPVGGFHEHTSGFNKGRDLLHTFQERPVPWS